VAEAGSLTSGPPGGKRSGPVCGAAQVRAGSSPRRAEIRPAISHAARRSQGSAACRRAGRRPCNR